MGVYAGRGQLYIGPRVRRGFAVVRGVDGPGRHGPAVRRGERFGVGVRAFSCTRPIRSGASCAHRQGSVRVERALDLGVGVVLELVRGGRHPSVLRQRGVTERE